MKHIKLYEEFVNEEFVNEYQEPIFQIDLKDLKVGDKVEWYGGEGNYRKLRATGVVKKIKSGAVEITDLEKVGTKVMALMGTVIDDNTRLFRVGPGGKLNNWRVVEGFVNESDPKVQAMRAKLNAALEDTIEKLKELHDARNEYESAGEMDADPDEIELAISDIDAEIMAVEGKRDKIKAELEKLKGQ